MILTVRAGADVRSQLIELVGVFGGDVLDIGPDELMVSLDDAPARLDDLEEMLRPYGIMELQRTGRVALPKLEHSLS
jgi:acetolactate synthase-1/3 small subunit